MGGPRLSKPELGLYWCGACKTLLPQDAFYVSTSRSTKVSNRCRPCSSASARQWNLAHPERARLSSAKHKASERRAETERQWREEHRSRLTEYMRNWRKDKSYCAFTRGKARASRAMPLWADTAGIAKFYEHARELRAATGLDWHVDHIIPLNGVSVCGLHVPNNLRVIFASDNRAKKNKYEENVL